MLITKSNSLHLYFQMKSSREESLAACSRCEVYIFTSSGRHSSAALLGTENPPCVLVSLAVNVLQKELLFLSTAGGGSSATKGFSLSRTGVRSIWAYTLSVSGCACER
jgi:hypothetical protein